MPAARPVSLITNRVETVYLLCLDKPLRHARHYLGWTINLEQRLKKHGTRAGSKMLFYARRELKITWLLVRTWHGTQELEYRLKDWKNSAFLCPRCAARKNCKPAPCKFAANAYLWRPGLPVRIFDNEIIELHDEEDRAFAVKLGAGYPAQLPQTEILF